MKRWRGECTHCTHCHCTHSLQDYTEKLKQFEKKKQAFEKPLKADFEKHMAQVEKSRLEELELLKKQYEHWLNEKDKALSGA